MLRVTRDVQERDDAVRQSQQQLEHRGDADSAEQQRHAAEIESLRSELQAAHNQIATQQQQHDEQRDDERKLQEQQQLHLLEEQQQKQQQQQQQQLMEHQLTVLRENAARLEQVSCGGLCAVCSVSCAPVVCDVCRLSCHVSRVTWCTVPVMCAV